MTSFGSAREAKEFLISRIVEQAQREGVPLSEVERKMLYFSETGWTLPDIMIVSEAFERDYDQEKFEKKIGRLVRDARVRARKETPQEVKAWSDAIRILRKEDHYLSVMVGHPSAPRHPFVDLLRAVGTGLALIVIFVFTLMFLEAHFPILRTREGSGFVGWWIGACVAGVYGLLWLFLGSEKASAALSKIIDPPFKLFERILEWCGLTE